MAVHLAVAGGVYDDVFLCCPFSRRDVLDEILDLFESVSEGCPTYSSICPSAISRRWHDYSAYFVPSAAHQEQTVHDPLKNGPSKQLPVTLYYNQSPDNISTYCFN